MGVVPKARFGSARSGAGFGQPYLEFLADRKLRHHSGKGAGSGYIERFKATVVKDFVLGPACDRKFADIGELQKVFNEWWRKYNQALLAGFPCYGKSPESMLRKPTG